MFKRIIVLFTGVITLGGILMTRTHRVPFHTPKDSNTESREVEMEPGEQWMFRQRAYPLGYIPARARSKAIQYVRKEFVRVRTPGSFENIGPYNIGGRITDIEITRNPDQSIYLGTASGGIFRSRDTGAHWTAIFDETFALPIGDIAPAPSNPRTIYVGTGEPNGGGGSIAYEGQGVFLSRDGGDTWKNIGLKHSASIGQIAVDPRDENKIFVAAMGPLYRKGEQRGLYKSEDGGNSWKRVLFLNDSTGCIQVLIDPAQPETVYAVAWQRFKTTTRRDYGGPASGIYKSTDGGAHWNQLSGGLPQEPDGFNRISLAMAPGASHILYSLFLDRKGYLYGLYQSTDRGESWVENFHWDQGGPSYGYWFGGLRVSPYDTRTLYYLGYYFLKSEDEGASFTANSSIHVDQHCMAFFPGEPGKYLVGNDGGLYLTHDGGMHFRHFENLPITQYYRIHVDRSNPERIYCGSQDNNTTRMTQGSAYNYEHILGGDGFQAVVHPIVSDRIYAEYQYGNLFRSDNDGEDFYLINTGINGNEPANWNFPYILSPKTPDVMYCGTDRIYRSEDGGLLWKPKSPRLTKKRYNGNQLFGTVTTIDVSRLNERVIYAGTDDGKLWLSKDAGETWIDITGTLPDRWVTKVLASRIHASQVWVSFSGYRHGPNDGHIFFSGDYGAHWTNLTGRLPDVPVNDLEEDEAGYLYAATDLGLYISYPDNQNGGDLQWDIFVEELSPMIITDLDYHQHFLYAGTYGRSGYKIQTSPGVAVKNLSSKNTGWSIRIPSKTKEELCFRLEGDAVPGHFEARIHSFSGRLVSVEKYTTDSRHSRLFCMHTSGLEQGLYLLSIKGEDGVKSCKFVTF